MTRSLADGGSGRLALRRERLDWNRPGQQAHHPQQQKSRRGRGHRPRDPALIQRTPGTREPQPPPRPGRRQLDREHYGHRVKHQRRTDLTPRQRGQRAGEAAGRAADVCDAAQGAHRGRRIVHRRPRAQCQPRSHRGQAAQPPCGRGRPRPHRGRSCGDQRALSHGALMPAAVEPGPQRTRRTQAQTGPETRARTRGVSRGPEAG